MKVSDDKTTATLRIDGTLTTVEIETLISDLLVLRAGMSPAVSLDPPDKNDPQLDQLAKISEQENPYLSVRRLRDGRVRLWIRNAGLGWMVFNLTADQASGVRDYLIANTPDASTGIGLFSKDVGNSGTTH